MPVAAAHLRRKYAVLRYDAFDRHVDEQETSDGDAIFDQRTVYDGSNLLEVLDGSNNVTERYLNGPAVNQVLAVEMVGGDNPGVNWLLAGRAAVGAATWCGRRRETPA